MKKVTMTETTYTCPSVDMVRETLETVYGSGPTVTALASNIVDLWDHWLDQADPDWGRDFPTLLQLHIWNWFSGGSTAQLAADRILEMA